MEVSRLNEASTSFDTDEVFHIEEDALSIWVSDDEEGAAITTLLIKLLKLWNKRVTKTVRGATVSYVKRAMAIHGVPFCETTKTNINLRTDFNFKYIPTCSIRDFFHDVSDIEGRLRKSIQNLELSYFAFDKLKKQFRERKMLNSPSVKLIDFARRLDYRSVAYHLGYLYAYRCHPSLINRKSLLISLRNKENLILEYPIVVMMILQVLISSKTNPRINLNFYLKRLAENAFAFVGNSTRIPVVDILVEILYTCIVLGYVQVATEIAILESRLSVRQKNEEDLTVLQYAKMLIFYDDFLKGRMSVSSKIRFTENLMLLHAGSIEPTLYLPAMSLRVQADIDTRDEERFNIVVDLMSTHPMFLDPLVDVLKNTKLDDNIIDAVDLACTKNEKDIHESSTVWLLFCKDRIRKPEKFGVIQEVLLSCMNRLFNFLDYASNKNNSSAWKELWLLVQKVSPESVQHLWEERKAWWPKFHSKPLNDEESQKYKTEVLIALSSELR